jgi:hypothetical protein
LMTKIKLAASHINDEVTYTRRTLNPAFRILYFTKSTIRGGRGESADRYAKYLDIFYEFKLLELSQ